MTKFDFSNKGMVLVTLARISERIRIRERSEDLEYAGQTREMVDRLAEFVRSMEATK